MYAHSNELEETGVVSLSAGTKVEYNPEMEALFAVSLLRFMPYNMPLTVLQRKHTFSLFTASNSYALSAPSAKELQSWITKLDPTRI